MNFNPAAAIMEVLHNIAAHPWVYDRIQTLAGQKRVLDRMSKRTAAISAEIVVDVGGGTGASRKLWPVSSRYICLDIEMPKLAGFRSNVPNGLAVLSDATRMPIASGSVDVVMCMALLHHLTDTMVDQVFEEVLRVLKVGGRLILLDPVLNSELLLGRILWKFDRGSYPRADEELRRKMEAKFQVVHWEKFAIYHEYVFGIGVREF
jgi:ubiquinone/menaquinone biosynthesis C-methylase UbiE